MGMAKRAKQGYGQLTDATSKGVRGWVRYGRCWSYTDSEMLRAVNKSGNSARFCQQHDAYFVTLDFTNRHKIFKLIWQH